MKRNCLSPVDLYLLKKGQEQNIVTIEDNSSSTTVQILDNHLETDNANQIDQMNFDENEVFTNSVITMNADVLDI